ncbi:MAG: GNAT family N-acetyltransferase [Dehalococcoidia bacterium]|nr:GNAT family N-acetyltransferase [Dehalococcoidia bacterium]
MFIQPVTHFAISTSAKAIGGIGFTPQTNIHRKSAEIGYWVEEPYWGKGIATLALNALARYAFNNFDLERLYATVFEGNNASARVMEKNGFKQEAHLAKSVTKNSQIIDSFVYAIIKGNIKPSLI